MASCLSAGRVSGVCLGPRGAEKDEGGDAREGKLELVDVIRAERVGEGRFLRERVDH